MPPTAWPDHSLIEPLHVRLASLDRDVERFCAAHDPAGVSGADRAAGELYLVLSVQAFADLCHEIEAHVKGLSFQDESAFELSLMGVMGLLSIMQAGQSLTWYCFMRYTYPLPMAGPAKCQLQDTH